MLTILGTGQPILRSIISAPLASTILAARANSSGTLPKSWMAVGRSPSSMASISLVLTLLYSKPLALIISETVIPQPKRLQMRRKGKSVMPAIGANAKGTFNSRLPSFILKPFSFLLKCLTKESPPKRAFTFYLEFFS